MRAEKQRNAGIHLRSNNSENTLSALCDITMIFLKSAYSVQLQSWMVVASQKEKKKSRINQHFQCGTGCPTLS